MLSYLLISPKTTRLPTQNVLRLGSGLFYCCIWNWLPSYICWRTDVSCSSHGRRGHLPYHAGQASPVCASFVPGWLQGFRVFGPLRCDEMRFQILQSRYNQSQESLAMHGCCVRHLPRLSAASAIVWAWQLVNVPPCGVAGLQYSKP